MLETEQGISASSLPEEWSQELEVVHAIYGEDSVRVVPCPQARSDGNPQLNFEIDLNPRVEQDAALVSLTLRLCLVSGYPATASPRVTIERSRGITDAGVSSISAAMAQAIDSYGLQEDGCICQLLAEASEALDLANDVVQCNICLELCTPGDKIIHPTCDHVVHSHCLGHWAALKDVEAEETAEEGGGGVRAERDALRREVAEAEVRKLIASEGIHAARQRVARRTRRVKRFRVQNRSAANTCEDAEDGIDEEDLGYETVFEDECPLDKLMEQLRDAKADLQSALAEERRAQTRNTENMRRVEALDSELAQAANKRASASLPCPVCRVPVKRFLFQAEASQAAQNLLAPKGSAKCPSSRDPASSVEKLPDALRAQVRDLQKQHAAISQKRQEQLDALLPATVSTDVTTDVVGGERPCSSQPASSGPEQRKGYERSDDWPVENCSWSAGWDNQRAGDWETDGRWWGSDASWHSTSGAETSTRRGRWGRG